MLGSGLFGDYVICYDRIDPEKKILVLITRIRVTPERLIKQVVLSVT